MTTSHDNRGGALSTRMAAMAVLFLLLLGTTSAGAATVEESANANVGANAATNGTNAGALQEVRAAAEQTAKSPELQGAVKNVWKMAWEKSWPFIKGAFLKFWDLLVQAWRTLVTLGKPSPAVTNANVNASADAATNATP